MKDEELRQMGHGALALETRARAALDSARADLFERKDPQANYELAQELYRQYVDRMMFITRKLMELR